MALKKEEVPSHVEILALMRGGAQGLYYVADSPPRCGAVKVKLVQLPVDIEPPFKAKLLKTRRGVALIDIQKVNTDDLILENIGDVIEGEVENGVLQGVVCNKKVKIRVADSSISGPVLAIIPVTRKTKKIPAVAFRVFTYRIQLT